ENAILLRHQRGYSEQQADPEPNPLRARPGALGRRAFARRRAIEAAQFGASHLNHVPIIGPRYSIGRNSGKISTETRQEFKIRHPRRGCRRGPHPCAYCFAPTSTSGAFDSRVTRPLRPSSSDTLPTADTPPVARPIFIPSDEASPHNATDTSSKTATAEISMQENVQWQRIPASAKLRAGP